MNPPLPLDGLRVVDFSGTPAGANVGMLLADYGAEVVLVEPPGGTSLRLAPAFAVWARGKKSVEIDLRTCSGRAEARRLVDGSDVVVETWRPGVAERLALGYEDVQAANPGLIYTSITGFGRSGPFADVKGYEGLVMAKLGYYTAFSAGALRPGPAFVAVPFATWSAAQLAVAGTLAALVERDSSGAGQRVDATLAQGIAAHDLSNWFLHIIRQRYPGAYEAAPVFDDDGVPTGGLMFMVLAALSKDGRWMQFSQIRPHLFKAFIEAAGLGWMYDDPDWCSLPHFEEATRRSEFWDRLLVAVREKTLDEWRDVFRASPDVWAETYRRGSDLLDHPQFAHLHGGIELEDPERGVVRQPAPLVSFSTGSPRITMPAPRLNEHRGLIESPARSDGARDEGPEPSPQLTSPLAGVTILEMGTFYAGPFGGSMLADLGARVIKVEPIDGEPFRSIQAFPEVGAIKVLQGKESIAIDLTNSRGQEIVHRIAAAADVVLQSYRAGVAQRLRIDSDALRAVNERLVYLYASGYGPDGPYASHPAFAPTIGAATGLGRRAVGDSFPERADLCMAEIRDRSRQLLVFNNNVYGHVDGFSALTAATAMLLGLVARQRHGASPTLLTTMLMAAAHALSDTVVEWDGMPPGQTPDGELYGLHACYRLYQSSDGWVFLAAESQREWDALGTALESDCPALVGDAQFASRELRLEHDAELSQLLECVFAQRPGTEWEKALTAADVGCVVVETRAVEDVLQSEEFGRASGLLVDVVHPLLDEHVRLAPLVSLSRSSVVPGAGCLLGQHTDAVLAEVGYSDDDIAKLRADGVVA